MVVSQDGTTATGHYVPVFLRDDGLVEGWELFRLRFHDEEQDSTIPSNGFITLRTAYASTNGNIVHGELELTGDIFGGGENYGVAVGSGGSLAYSTTGSSNVLTLTFTDVTGEDGSGGPDGILSGTNWPPPALGRTIPPLWCWIASARFRRIWRGTSSSAARRWTGSALRPNSPR